MFEKFGHDFYINFIKDDRYTWLLDGLKNTMIITVFALLIGICIGFLVAIIRSSHDKSGNFKIANSICRVYLTVIRGTPTVIQLLIMNFVVFGSVSVNEILVGSLAFGINSGAYVAEIVRSGIMSIDQGQTEAGRSLGLNFTQTMRLIIIPQAFKNVLPALVYRADQGNFYYRLHRNDGPDQGCNADPEPYLQCFYASSGSSCNLSDRGHGTDLLYE